RGAFLRDDAEADQAQDPGDPCSGRLPAGPSQRGDGAPVARDAAESRARARAFDLAGAAPARRADDRSRSALEARGAGLHQGGSPPARRDDPALHARHERGGDARGPHRHPRPRRASLPRAGGGRETAVRRRHARGGVLRRDGPRLRRGARGRRATGGVRLMSEFALALRHELVGLGGIVERNIYLTKRYLLWDVAFLVWTIANTLTIVFIARGVGLSAAAQNSLETKLLVGGVIWAFLGIIFQLVTEAVALEPWEGHVGF